MERGNHKKIECSRKDWYLEISSPSMSKKAVGSKSVFSIKHKADGSIKM